MKRLLSLIILVLLIVFNTQVAGQEVQFEKIAEIPFFSEVNKIDIHGNNLFINSFDSYDISNPFNPVGIPNTPAEVGWIDSPLGLYFYNDYCLFHYSCEGYSKRLQLMDISDFNSPVHIWDIQPGHYCDEEFGWIGEVIRDMDFEGNYAFATYYGHNLGIMNLTTGNEYIPELHPLSYVSSYDIDVENGIVCLACGEDGIRIVDVTDIQSPVVVGAFYEVNNVRKLYLHNDYLYLGDGSDLVILDISNPANPIQKNRINTESQIHEITIKNDLLYICNGNAGLRVLDISSPEAPIITNNYDLNGDIRDIDFKNNLAYIVDYTGFIYILDLTNTEEATSFGFNKDMYAMTTSDNYLIGISPDKYDVSFFNLNNPNEIIEKTLSNGIYPFYHSGEMKITCKDDFLFLLQTDRVAIYDVGDPAEFSLAGEFEFGYERYDNFIIYDHYLYMFEDFRDMKILDISDPNNPVQFFQLSYDLETGSEIIKTFEHYILIGNSDAIQMIDITNPSWPVAQEPFDAIDNISDFVVYGNYLYLACEQDGLVILDITDVTNPIYVNTLPIEEGSESRAENVFIKDDYLFVNYSIYPDPNLLVVYDLTDPANPVENTTYNNFPGSFSQFLVYNQTIITNKKWLTFTEFTLPGNSPLDSQWNNLVSIPQKFEIAKTYPNPFNPSLNVEIALPQSGQLQVSVFNMLGQQVATLANRPCQAGNHTFTFDGSNLSSGVYFVKASLPGEANQMQKVILMK